MGKDQLKITGSSLIDLTTVGLLILAGMYIQSLRSDLNASAKEMDRFWSALTTIDLRLQNIEKGSCTHGP